MSEESELDRGHASALVRRADGLWVATTQRRRVYPFDSPLEPAPVVAADRIELSTLKAFPFPRRSGILGAWRRLQSAGKDGPETLAAALIVLIESVPAAEIENIRTIPLRRAFSEKSDPRSTAAHPRGYRGTKHKPPKAPVSEDVDLRGVLCDRKQTAVALQRLWMHRRRAADALGAHGFPPARIARLLSTDEPPIDTFVTYHNEDTPAGRALLTPDFVERALFSVVALPWRAVRRAHAAWIDLEVSRHGGMLRDLAVHALATGQQHAIEWIELAATIPVERRIPFLALISFLCRLRFLDQSQLDPRIASRLFAKLPAFVEALKQVPSAYTAQFANDTGALLFDIPKRQIPDRLALATKLLPQLNRPPFNPDGYLHWSLEYLLNLTEPWLTRAFTLPERAFLHLDRASRRKNEAALISRGIRNLAERTPEWLLISLESEPATVIRIARGLGSFPWAVRNDLVTEWRKNEIHKVDGSSPVERLKSVLDREAGSEAGIIPRAIRDWAARRRVLSSNQLTAAPSWRVSFSPFPTKTN